MPKKLAFEPGCKHKICYHCLVKSLEQGSSVGNICIVCKNKCKLDVQAIAFAARCVLFVSFFFVFIFIIFLFW